MKDSIVAQSAAEGVHALSTSAAATILLDGVLDSNNIFGVMSEGTQATVRLSKTALSGNTSGIVSLASGQIVSVGNNSNFDSGTPTSTIPQQ